MSDLITMALSAVDTVVPLPAPEVKEFTVFPCFPLEIRQRIWFFALPGPRPIAIELNTRYEVRSRAPAASTNTRIPTLLHTTHESRLEAKGYYQLAFEHHLHGKPIYFDFKIDILYFSTHRCFDQFFAGAGQTGSRKDQELKFIQNNLRNVLLREIRPLVFDWELVASSLTFANSNHIYNLKALESFFFSANLFQTSDMAYFFFISVEMMKRCKITRKKGATIPEVTFIPNRLLNGLVACLQEGFSYSLKEIQEIGGPNPYDKADDI